MKYEEHFKALRPNDAYDPQNALSLALACALSYASQRPIKKCVEKTWCYEFLALVSREKKPDIDTQCFLMADKDNIVVVFRGGDSSSDWFTSFQASQDPGPFDTTGAHEGFQDALFPAVIKLTEMLRADAAKPRRVWITGHSLGGALCSLYAGMLLENGIDVYGIYTFASPRPGNAKFASELNKRLKAPHFRIVNSGDLVPHLPPEPFFSHPGNRVILKHNHKKRTKGSWLDERIAALKNFVDMTGKRFDIADNHRLIKGDDSYVPRLIEDLAREERRKKQ
ncbi:MAG: triacylglycerol lipase [Glaciecola sp.]|jgi:triacylglycerol lipase|uniref:lipase family protein n=1 Tax=Congregibacter sp. TaxID=2744308 RepID=UPI0039E5B8CD